MKTRLLVVHTGGIGDFICTFPALSALSPTCEIAVAGIPERAMLARAAGLARKIHDLDRTGFPSVFSEPDSRLRAFANSFDEALVWMADSDGMIQRNLHAAGIPRVRCFPGIPPSDWGAHAACWYGACVGVPISLPYLAHFRKASDPPAGPVDLLLHCRTKMKLGGFVIPANARIQGRGDANLARALDPRVRGDDSLLKSSDFDPLYRRLGTKPTAPTVVIQPGSGSRLKNWPLACFEDLAERLAGRGLRVSWCTGPAEEGLPAMPGALPPMPLTELASLLAGAGLFVGNDSGISHLAAAAGCPTLAIFGPTDPAVWGPTGPRVRVLQGQPWPDTGSVYEAALALLDAPQAPCPLP